MSSDLPQGDASPERRGHSGVIPTKMDGHFSIALYGQFWFRPVFLRDWCADCKGTTAEACKPKFIELGESGLCLLAAGFLFYQ